jgi:hypothetical protein
LAYDALRPAYAGELSLAINTMPPRPEPSGILAMRPDEVPSLPEYYHGNAAKPEGRWARLNRQ